MSQTAILTRKRIPEIILFTGLVIAGALFTSGPQVIRTPFRFIFFIIGTLLLFHHAFLFNDWCEKGLQKEKALLISSSGALIFSLLIFSWYSIESVILAILISILGFLYSHPRISAKEIPVVSSLLHFVAGVAQFFLGASFARLGRAEDLWVAFYFGLILVAGHLHQEAEHVEVDRQNGIRTNAVRFGPRRIDQISMAVFSLSTAFLWLFWEADGHLSFILPVTMTPTTVAHLAVFLYYASDKMAGKSYRLFYRVIYLLAGIQIILRLFFTESWAFA